MPNAKDVTPSSEWLKACSVGIPGSGKSIFGSSFPTPGFVFDFGSQILSYRGLDFDYEQFPSDTKGWIQFEKVLQSIIKGSYYKEQKEQEGQYQSIIVDDLTGMGDLALVRAMQLDPKRSLTDGPIWNVHYQMQKNLMEGRLKQIYDIPANILFIMHHQFVTDQSTGDILGSEPLLVGQLSTRIPAMFDEVFYHTTRREGGETRWLMQTVPIGFNNGRSRLSGKARLIPDLISNDYNEVMAYATGKKKRIVKSSVVQTVKNGGEKK